MTDFNNDGYLAPGFHTYTYEEFKVQFVDEFTTSTTRKDIHNKCFHWFELANAITQPVEVWLNGSFTSVKINPNDIDFCCFFDRSLLNQHIYDEWDLLSKQSKIYNCDAFHGMINNNNATGQDINTRNYWRGQFGFDRSDVPKGIVILQWEEIKKGIQIVRGGVI